MPSTYADGTLVFGTPLITIGALTNLIADDVDIDDPTNILTRKDNQGKPVAELMIDEVMTGTATIQMPTATIALPAKGSYFTLPDVTGTPLHLKVVKWGRKMGNDKETKIPLTFRQAFNPPAN